MDTVSNENAEDRGRQFFAYYRGATDAAAGLSGSGHIPMLQKISFVAVMDALGKAIYPRSESRARFTQLVEFFGGWPESKNVSLSHLDALLDRYPDPAFEGLRDLVKEMLGTWSSGEVITLDKDPDIALVQKVWPKDPSHRTLGGLSLDYFKHSHLLYNYRNQLVHEFRERADRFGKDDREYPFYRHLTTLGLEHETDRWDLFYPGGFFRVLAATTLDSVEKYFVERRLDPTRYFTSGAYLLEALCD